MIELTPYQRETLHALIVDAFSGDDLAVMVGIHLGEGLEVMVDVHQDHPKIVLDLISAIEGRGELEALLRGVLKSRPKRDDIQGFCQEHFPHVMQDVVPASLVENTATAVNFVVDSLQDPEVRLIVGRFQADFRTIEKRTHVVSGYKQLHEALHVVQWQLPAIQDAAGRFDQDMNAAKLLSRQLLELRKQVGRAREQAKELPTAAMEASWIDEYEQAVATARQALEATDRDTMLAVIHDFRALLRESTRIDGQLAVAVSDLPLGKLIEALGEIERNRDEDEHAEGGAAGQQIRGGRDSLALIRPRLAGLVAQHNLWQWLDKELAGIETNPGNKPQDKVPRWGKVKEKLNGLCSAFPGDEWSMKILEHLSGWETAANGNESQACEMEAYALRGEAMDRFFEVDAEMRNLCENLVQVGIPLRTLLEAYTDGNP